MDPNKVNNNNNNNIFFDTTLLTNLDFRFVYDAFYQAILLEWTIVGVSAVTVIIAVRCWCCSCLTFGQDTDVMFGYDAFTIVHTAVANFTEFLLNILCSGFDDGKCLSTKLKKFLPTLVLTFVL